MASGGYTYSICKYFIQIRIRHNKFNQGCATMDLFILFFLNRNKLCPE